MRKVWLINSDECAVVDDIDFQLACTCQWYILSDGHVKGISYSGKEERLHRLIMGVTDKKLHVHHIDHNPLNNTKENLVICTPQEHRLLTHTDKFKAINVAASKHGGKCLSTVYKNARTKLLWQCEHGHTWEALYSVIKRGSWCPICSQIKRKYTIEYCQQVAHDHGGDCLSEEYKNANSKLLWQCWYKHDPWYATLGTIQNIKSWCPTCANRPKITIEKCDELAQSYGGRCRSTVYKNNTTKLLWECHEGHTWEATYGSVAYQKIWCPVCDGRLPKTPKDYQELATKMHGTFLDSDIPKSTHDDAHWKCESGHTWAASFNNINTHSTWCPKCNPNTSSYELEIKEFLMRDCGILEEDIVLNTRTIIAPYELDIYIPKLQVGIEINGLHWHSYEQLSISRKNRDAKLYHKEKQDLAEKAGIRLIQVFEDEWLDKRSIICDVIKQALGLNRDDRIFARKCAIREVSFSDTRDFLNKYHFQGIGQTDQPIRYGLYFNDDLVAVMTFKQGSFSQHIEKESGVYDLYKYCTKGNVIGGLQKLLSHFEKMHNPVKVYSLCCRRLFTGKAFVNAGLEFKRNTVPNYFYFKNLKRFSRTEKMKNDLARDANMTEYEYWHSQGFDKIYDAGSLYLEKVYS